MCASYFDFVCAALETHASFSATASLIAVWLTLSLLCLIRPLKAVSWLSTAALLIYIYIFFLLFYFGSTQRELRTQPLRWLRPAGLGAWFGPALFAFEGMGTALSIYASMDTASPEPFYAIIRIAYLCIFALYCFVAVLGYSAWGEHVAQACE